MDVCAHLGSALRFVLHSGSGLGAKMAARSLPLPLLLAVVMAVVMDMAKVALGLG